jgi:hypothetical protein
MIEPDFETKQKTLLLRDAFRVLWWQTFDTNLQNREDLNELYTKFYTRWYKSRLSKMDLNQLEECEAERGYTAEKLLFYRECYYSTA